MILDEFKTTSLSFQVQYESKYVLWDRAGTVAERLCKIWPGLKLKEVQPQQQLLATDGVGVLTAVTNSTITLTGPKVFDARSMAQVKETFETWRDVLELDNLERVSSRVQYVKMFASLKEANAELLALKLARWPTTKVFDQPIDAEKNSIEVAYRFEDQNSFSVLRIKAEQLKAEVALDPEIFDETKLSKELNRIVIDFDRGLLGKINARKLFADEWLKGYAHILRRDLEKVLKAQA